MKVRDAPIWKTATSAWSSALLSTPNVFKKNVLMNPVQFQHLKRQKDVRALASKCTSLKEKHRFVSQRGGFLGLPIVPAITALNSILAGQLFPSIANEWMERAKCMHLIDKFDRRYKQLECPTGSIAKAHNAIRLNDTLSDKNLDEHEKVRHYVAELYRYLNVSVPVRIEHHRSDVASYFERVNRVHRSNSTWTTCHLRVAFFVQSSLWGRTSLWPASKW